MAVVGRFEHDQAARVGFMNDESLERVKTLGERSYVDNHGHKQPYLTPYEVANLSIRRGTLNDDEWENMRSHATFSENYLERIPWGSELARVPCIAGAHHEKLDGSGYPHGLTDGEIAPQSKIMTVADIFDALISSLEDTRLEPDLDDLLWSTVNVFHRATDRIARELDDNEQAQKRLQREQDGSEVRSVELEALTAQGTTLIERRNAYELMRDIAADHFETHIGQTWQPHSGSRISHRTLTAAMIDSRDYLSAKRRAEIEPLLPTGPRVAFSGGLDVTDHRAIWDALDRVKAKHADMVLVHGGSPKGAEKIAACWADNRKCQQIVFKPDWKRHGKAAPFKRNDQMLEILPKGVLHFPGTGINDNLACDAVKGKGSSARAKGQSRSSMETAP